MASLDGTQKLLNFEFNGNLIDVAEIAEALVQEQSTILDQGPKVLLLMTILRACGINVNDALTAGGDITNPYNLFDLKCFPLFEMNFGPQSRGLIEIPYELQGLVNIASRKENWSLLQDPITDPETYETSDPSLTLDIEKNITWVLNSTVSRNYDYWREDYSAPLINLFIKPGQEYVEEDDCWTSDVGVCSTSYGHVHQHGGMNEDEMYLIVSGSSMFQYDEDGWYDPEKETPTAYRKLKKLLFGDPDYPTQKYTPQFGG